jgi:hypothetical protein
MKQYAETKSFSGASHQHRPGARRGSALYSSERSEEQAYDVTWSTAPYRPLGARRWRHYGRARPGAYSQGHPERFPALAVACLLTQAIDIVLLGIERLAWLGYPGSDKLLALGVPIEWMLPTDSARGG